MGSEIPKAKKLAETVFGITNEKEFRQIALEVYRFQYLTNPVYKAFCDAIRRSPETVRQLEEIPFLPIQFFKNHEVKSGSFVPQSVFRSSGTTGSVSSRHFVKDLSIYRRSFLSCFEAFYGKPNEYCVLGLLPSYLERGDSSLVYMVNDLIQESGHELSGFYLHDLQELQKTLLVLEEKQQKTILFGVTYALLGLAETFPTTLQHTTIIETGGMKGRKKEISKAELYSRLQRAFSLEEIHSEYGMTELLSQAYAINGFYNTPPWMKILLREETDPFAFSQRTGAINVIDLANIDSCSFIATDDLGRLHSNGSFEVLGRMDNTDVRGCSQLTL